MYQIMSTRYMVQLDADMMGIAGLYDISLDPLLRNNMLGHSIKAQNNIPQKVPVSTEYDADEVNRMITFARAFMQDYTTRLTEDRMSITNENNSVLKSSDNNGQKR